MTPRIFEIWSNHGNADEPCSPVVLDVKLETLLTGFLVLASWGELLLLPVKAASLIVLLLLLLVPMTSCLPAPLVIALVFLELAGVMTDGFIIASEVPEPFLVLFWLLAAVMLEVMLAVVAAVVVFVALVPIGLPFG